MIYNAYTSTSQHYSSTNCASTKLQKFVASGRAISNILPRTDFLTIGLRKHEGRRSPLHSFAYPAMRLHSLRTWGTQPISFRLKHLRAHQSMLRFEPFLARGPQDDWQWPHEDILSTLYGELSGMRVMAQYHRLICLCSSTTSAFSKTNRGQHRRYAAKRNYLLTPDSLRTSRWEELPRTGHWYWYWPNSYGEFMTVFSKTVAERVRVPGLCMRVRRF